MHTSNLKPNYLAWVAVEPQHNQQPTQVQHTLCLATATGHKPTNVKMMMITWRHAAVAIYCLLRAIAKGGHRDAPSPLPPQNPSAPCRFLLNSGVEPSFPIFPTFATHIFSRCSLHRNMIILCITLGKKLHFSVCQKCSVTQKYAKNASSGKASPQTPLGELTTLSLTPSQLGRGHPSPDPTSLSVIGASIVAFLVFATCVLLAQTWCPPLL